MAHRKIKGHFRANGIGHGFSGSECSSEYVSNDPIRVSVAARENGGKSWRVRENRFALCRILLNYGYRADCIRGVDSAQCWIESRPVPRPAQLARLNLIGLSALTRQSSRQIRFTSCGGLREKIGSGEQDPRCTLATNRVCSVELSFGRITSNTDESQRPAMVVRYISRR